nr:hypothetical protein [Desulfobulbaceae bacterium]
MGLKTYLVAGIVLLTAGTSWAAAPQLTTGALGAAPTLDGKADEWSGISGVKIKVSPSTPGDAKAYQGEVEVDLKAAINGDMIYFLAQWPDSTKSDTHKQLTWDKEKDGYVEGEDREDRFVLNFDMGGDFSSCMLSGKAYQADIWHWKAYRSQSAGIAHDKMHIMSFEKIPKAKKHPTRDGKEIWIARPSDAGDDMYKSQKPLDNIGDVIPRYVPNKAVSGSIADIKTEAIWADGVWTLEMARKLDTGNADDVKFEKGKSYAANVAVFDHTGDDHHSVGAWTLEVK